MCLRPERYIGTIAKSKFESLGDGINTVAGSDTEMLQAESQSRTVVWSKALVLDNEMKQSKTLVLDVESQSAGCWSLPH